MEEIDYEFESAFNRNYSMLSRRLFRLICENSRASISELGLLLGVSRHMVLTRLRALEEGLQLYYTIEFNEDALGLQSPHIVLIKFNKKPDYSAIKSLFLKSYIPQFVSRIDGDFDLLVYANAPTRGEYVHWDKSMQIKLAEYGTLWQTSEIAHRQLGFFPIRNELLERLNIEDRYKKMLLLLNQNARMPLKELAKRLGMHVNTVSYSFNKLVESSYIKRFTAVVQNRKSFVIMTLFGKYTISEKFEADAANERRALMSDDEYSIVSRYPVVSQLVGSYDYFSIGAFDDMKAALKYDIGFYKNAMSKDKVQTRSGTISEVLLGALPLRSFDSKRKYNLIKWVFEEQVQPQTSKDI